MVVKIHQKGDYKGYSLSIEEDLSSPVYYRYIIEKINENEEIVRHRLWSPHGLPSFSLVEDKIFKKAVDIFLESIKDDEPKIKRKSRK